jgi:hypothetical protein
MNECAYGKSLLPEYILFDSMKRFTGEGSGSFSLEKGWGEVVKIWANQKTSLLFFRYTFTIKTKDA